MAKRFVVDVDLVDVWAEPGRKKYVRTLGWGDEVLVTRQSPSVAEIQTVDFDQQQDGSVLPVKLEGFIEPKKSSGLKTTDLLRPRAQSRVLKVNFVDVQQGDGAVIESPDGRIILVDGGDNQMFARYLAARFRGTSAANPKPIDCILVTHGDADHFQGLCEIHKSETNVTPRKRIFIAPKRCYHNGIVKRPSKRNGKSVPEQEMLGATKRLGDKTYIVGLEKDLLRVPDSELNERFRDWKQALKEYDKRSKIEFRRLEFGDTQAFSFFETDGLRIEVLGPLVTKIDGKSALRFLGRPPAGPRVGHESLSLEDEAKGLSASHTINGHSIVFRLVYGGFRYLFSGDLNDEAGRILTREHNAGRLDLRSEVFKVPHHGSADFSGAFVEAVAPVVSIVSSGDESARKEYVHPRATMMGALGKCSRVPEPLVFVTELVAFFEVEGYAQLSRPKGAKQQRRGEFFGFSRTLYGLVKTRTDGRRLLVYTDSGNVQLKEAYAYALDPAGVPRPAPVVRA